VRGRAGPEDNGLVQLEPESPTLGEPD
jgi:hypothetical protein